MGIYRNAKGHWGPMGSYTISSHQNVPLYPLKTLKLPSVFLMDIYPLVPPKDPMGPYGTLRIPYGYIPPCTPMGPYGYIALRYPMDSPQSPLHCPKVLQVIPKCTPKFTLLYSHDITFGYNGGRGGWHYKVCSMILFNPKTEYCLNV